MNMSSANTERWEKKIIDVGTVKVGTKLDIVFKATRPLEIEDIKVGCTCTKFHYSNKDNTLLVIYKAGSIPFKSCRFLYYIKNIKYIL